MKSKKLLDNENENRKSSHTQTHPCSVNVIWTNKKQKIALFSTQRLKHNAYMLLIAEYKHLNRIIKDFKDLYDRQPQTWRSQQLSRRINKNPETQWEHRQ